MKWLITILFLIPFLCKSQDVQTIEVGEGALSTQEYWVDDGPNTYYWSVENGDIINGQGSNSITIEWEGVPYGQYLLNVSIISNIGCIGDTSYLIIDIDDCSFDGVTTPLVGITVDDFRWSFDSNGVVADSAPDALSSMVANATATVLAVGVP